MSKNNYDKKQYSGTDIQKYLDGQMDAQEMYALEKAALEDPFLADAIEGYMMKDATGNRQNMEELNKRLAAKTSKPKTIFFYKRVFQSAAAVILLIAGIYAVNSLLIKDTSRPLAITKEEVPVITDTSHIQRSTPSVSNSNPARNYTTASDTIPAVLPDNTRLKAKPVVTDLPPGSIPQKSIVSNNLKLSGGNITMPRQEDMAKKEKASFSELKALLKENSDSARSQSLDEVVVTGYGTQKKTSITGSVSTLENAVVITTVLKATPVVDDSTYQVYLDKNKVVPPAEANIHGTVLVTFTVTRSGRLTDFKIERSLSPLLDKEAIRLIRKGPKWHGTKNRRTPASVTVSY